MPDTVLNAWDMPMNNKDKVPYLGGTRIPSRGEKKINNEHILINCIFVRSG